MAYDADARLAAYQHYLRGLSFDKIVSKMRDQYPSLRAKTVQDWAKRYDWEAQRNRQIKEAMEMLGRDVIDEQLKAAEELEGIAEQLRKQLKVSEIKSHEAAIYALVKLRETALKLRHAWPGQEGQGPQANPFAIADKLLKVLEKVDPQIKKLIQKKRHAIAAQLKKELPLMEGGK